MTQLCVPAGTPVFVNVNVGSIQKLELAVTVPTSDPLMHRGVDAAIAPLRGASAIDAAVELVPQLLLPASAPRCSRNRCRAGPCRGAESAKSGLRKPLVDVLAHADDGVVDLKSHPDEGQPNESGDRTQDQHGDP